MNRKAISEPCLSLDRERGIAGILTARRSGHVREIDWNSLLHGKKILTDQELADADVEVPRNSLESSPGTRTPRFSGVRHDDIPYGFELPSKPAIQPQCSRFGDVSHSSRSGGELGKKKSSAPAEVLPIKTLIAQDSCEAEMERKRRSAPSVVARLMGLDSLPDKLSKGSSGTPKPPKPSKSTPSSHGSKRETKPHSARAETSGRPPSPLHDVDTIKDFPLPRSRAQMDSDVYEDKSKFDVLPFRAHPQERQLQEFKKEFMDKLATRHHGPPPSATNDSKDERRRHLREKLGEAKLALMSGGDESTRLSSAQEKLMESKEFHDAIELLQTNKEFFKKFFPDSNSSSFGNKDPPEPESTSRRSFSLEDLCKEPVGHDKTSRRSFHLGDFVRDSRQSGFLHEPPKEAGRRSFHLDELSRESRKSLLQAHESPKETSGRRSFHLDESRRSRYLNDVTKEIRAHDDYPDLRQAGHVIVSTGRGLEPRRRKESKHKSSGANQVPEEMLVLQKSSKVSTMDKEVSSWATPDHNSNGRHSSPNNFDSRKGCDSPSRIVVLRPGPNDITILSPLTAPNCSPRSYGGARDSRGGTFDARDVSPPELPERISPPRIEEYRYSKGHREDYRVDPRAIARDIVREARTNSTREISRERETGRRESPRPGDASLTRLSGSGGKKASIPKNGVGTEDMSEPMVGSFTMAALSRRNYGKEERCSSPTVPNPSPRVRSRETATTSERSSLKEGKQQQRRSSEKPKAVYQVEHIEEEQCYINASSATEVRKTTSHVHEIYRSTISRHRQYVPGNKGPGAKGRLDSFPESQIGPADCKNLDAEMYSSLPRTEKILKVETMYPSNPYVTTADQSKGDSTKSRSVPSAVVAGTRTRNAETASRIGVNIDQVQVPERMESSQHFYLKEKRAEARQAFLLNKRSIAGVDASTSGRSGHNQGWPSEEHTAVQDVHIDANVGSSLALQPHHFSVMTRNCFESSIPIESGPRHGGRARDNNLLDGLAHLNPETPSQSKDISETEKFRTLSSHKQLEVPVCQQVSKNSKAWLIATDTLDSGDGDVSSETSIDKCGQPSPVSVLDSPFEAEIPSPVEFKEISSDLQDLRLRLRLLKFDGCERPSTSSEGLRSKYKVVSQNLVVRHTENSFESTECTSTSSIFRDFESREPVWQPLLLGLERINLEGLPCPEGRQEDLVYVTNLLIASGLAEGNSSTAFAKWHSPTCPLDPGLYEKLETFYADVRVPFINVENGSIKSKAIVPGSRDSWTRRLLFDVVNEVMSKIWSPYLSYRPWARPFSPLLRPIPIDQQLVCRIWVEICSYFSPKVTEEFEALDCLMARDVARGGPWLDSLEIREMISLEMESTIMESLIEETVHLLLSPYRIM